MDAELRNLRTKFQSLQAQTVANRINERNIIEIVQLIHKRRRLVDLLYTSDGKAFVTWDHLRREIVDEVYAHNGRMNTVELPAALNVDMTCIERALPQVLEERRGELVLHMGELMTQMYLDSLVADAAETLKETGCLVVGDFAKNCQLASAFIGDVLMEAVQSKRLTAEMASGAGALYTPVYVISQLSVLRSSLVARTQPVGILDVARRRNINLALLPMLLDRLQSQLPGAIEGGVSGQYIPRAFTEKRDQQVHNIYSMNGYIEFTAVSKLGVGAPKRFLESTYNLLAQQDVSSPTDSGKGNRTTGGSRGKKGARAAASAGDGNANQVTLVRATATHPMAGHTLAHCFLSDKLLIRVAESLDDLFTNTAEVSSFDLSEHLPSAVDLSVDFEIIVQRLTELVPGCSDCFVLCNRVFVRKALITSSLPAIRDMVSSDVRRYKQRPAAAVDADKKPKGKAKEKDDGALGGSGGGLLEFVLSSRSLISCLSNILRGPYTNFVDNDARREELTDLISHLQSDILAIVQTVAESQAQTEAQEKKRLRVEHQKRCSDAWSELCVTVRSLEWADKELDPVDAATIHRAVLQGPCAALFRDVLVDESQSLSPELQEKLQGLLSAVAINWKAAIGLFDKKKIPALSNVVETLSGKSASKFASALEELCTTGEIGLGCFHSLNKKVERELASAMRQKLHDEVKALVIRADPSQVAPQFASCVSSVLASAARVTLPIPGKSVAGVCHWLQRADNLPDELKGALSACKDIIVAAITSNSISDDDIAQLNRLRDLIIGGSE